MPDFARQGLRNGVKPANRSWLSTGADSIHDDNRVPAFPRFHQCRPFAIVSRTAKQVCPCLRNWRATNRPAASSPRHSFPIPITRVGLLCRSAYIKCASVTNNPCCNVSLAIYFQLQKVGSARDARVIVAHGLFTAGTKL